MAKTVIWSDLEPVLTTDARGNIKRLINEEAVGGSIRNFITTSPGDRFMECWFGFGIDRLLFQATTQQKFNQLTSRMKSDIERHEPRAKIINIQATLDADNNTADITIAYRVVGLPDTYYTKATVTGA